MEYDVWFVRVWQTSYLVLQALGLLRRLRGPYFHDVDIVILNGAAIVVTATSIFLFERNRRSGGLVLVWLSVLRILVIVLCGSVVFAFVAAYVPTGPVLWAPLLQLPTGTYWLACSGLLACEILFLVQVRRERMRARSPD